MESKKFVASLGSGDREASTQGEADAEGVGAEEWPHRGTIQPMGKA